MASSQPIALPAAGIDDHPMQSPAYFNPASYTRAIFGSPISWRAGSFGSRFYPGSSPGQLLGPLDPTDFRAGKLSSSIESDHGSILNAAMQMQREEELCRNYTCCGYQLPDLHALVDHFEEAHVVVLDPYAQQQHALAHSTHQPTQHQHHLQQPQQQQQQYPPRTGYYPPPSSFDPDDMELEMDDSPPSSSSPSPPHTPSTVSSPYPSQSSAYAGKQQAYYPPSYSATPMSSACPSPVSAFDTTAVLPSRGGVAAFPPVQQAMRTPTTDAFNAYSGFVDYSQQGAAEAGVPPALLYCASTSRTSSPTQAAAKQQQQPVAGGSTSAQPSSATTPRASTTLSRPASSLLLSKPFRCPKPNCSKSYKQANGLKYHMTHGSCNFAPPKDLEALHALLAEKGVGEDGAARGVPMTEGEMREVEREAERRLRPFACGVGDCQRRYKNMNGLRYHYQHSGEHGALGLQLLASGQHECLQHTASPARSQKPSRAPTPAQPPASSVPAQWQQYAAQSQLYNQGQGYRYAGQGY